MSVKRRLLGIGGKVRLSILPVLLVLSFVPLTSAAADFYVATNGDDANDCLSGATPCLTIAAAMDKAVTDPASSHDTVYIAAGTYNENLAINADFDLVGAGSGLTIIDGGGSDRVVAVGSSRTVAIQDLTMQNGATTLHGGGIVNSSGSSLTITNSIVHNNTSTASGGGIYNYGVLSLNTVEITGNQGNFGGAVYNASSGSVTIANSTLSGNNVTSTGGAAVFNAGGTVIIEKTTISGNSSDSTASNVIHNQNGGSIGLTNVTISSNPVSDKVLLN